MTGYKTDYKTEPRQRDTDWVIEKAQAALEVPVFYIMDMQSPCSTDGPHDYYSNGDYWWPDPDMSDGLSYIRRDGRINPDNSDGHRIVIRQMRTNVVFLASAYVPTGGKRYAARMVRHLREFFLDRDTYMAPHLSYAQTILEICPGRGIGVTDTLHLVDVVFAIEYSRELFSMEPEVYEGLKKWSVRYLGWMLADANGTQEMNRDNNHGVCFSVQAAVFARFTDDGRIADLCREYYRRDLLEQEVEDGSFLRKLERTELYNRSLFIVDNMVSMCHLSSSPGDDPWEYEFPDGKNMKKTLDFITPYVLDKKCWPYSSDVMHFDAFPARYGFMTLAGCALGCRESLGLCGRLPTESTDEEARRNTALQQPMLRMWEEL